MERVSLTNINIFQKLKYWINLNIDGKNRNVSIFFFK